LTVPPPPAGWFTDPGNPAQFRFWDGFQWTQHVQPIVTPQGFAPPQQFVPPQQAATQQQAVAAQDPALDEHGDTILFSERTHGSAKSNVTITANRFTAGKRSIAFADVELMLVDVTQLLSMGIKSGVSYQITLNGPNTKAVGMYTQSLPLRSGREEAQRQFETMDALLETHLVPQLLARLHQRVMSGTNVTIGNATLSAEGIATGRSSIRWHEYCGAVEDGRAIRVLGPTPDNVVGTTYVRFPNARLLARLCDRCAPRR
jgi:Protein of unknown function (DUF2510)